MLRSVAVLVVVMVVFFALSQGKIHPRTAYRKLKKLDTNKRQTPEQDQCVDAKIEEKLSNSECVKRAGELESVIDAILADTEDDQGVVNTAFQLFCLPECGTIFLEAEDECGVLDVDSRNLFVGICGNINGTPCYEYFDETLEFLQPSIVCYFNATLGFPCQCRSQLLSAVGEQGCCINVYQDFAQAIAEERFIYRPDELYGFCDVRQPNDCNNSPLGGSVAVSASILSVAAALLLALFG